MRLENRDLLDRAKRTIEQNTTLLEQNYTLQQVYNLLTSHPDRYQCIPRDDAQEMIRRLDHTTKDYDKRNGAFFVQKILAAHNRLAPVPHVKNETLED